MTGGEGNERSRFHFSDSRIGCNCGGGGPRGRGPHHDGRGAPGGDDALRLVANVIRETLRGADVAARFGGEEFSILLPQTTSVEAIAIAERIRHNIEKTRFEHRVVTSSIGVASCSAELCVSADLVAAADKALYEAKRKGRNRVQAFEGLVKK